MLRELDLDFELREIDLDNKPEDFVELSPTGKVPMLVEDDFVLYESQIINDYLVSTYNWDSAYASDERLEHRQKVCMKQWDSTILGTVYESLSQPGKIENEWEDMKAELEYLLDVVNATNRETNNLFSYHFAPFWARFRWLEDHTPFPRKVEEIGSLAEWLDSTLDDKPISKTLPDREWAVEQYEEHYVNTG